MIPQLSQCFICLSFQGKTLKFYCEFHSQLDEDLADNDAGDDSAGSEMLNVINVSIMDDSNKDKVYCAETENMDVVSIKACCIINKVL